jgi:hypothetical protein
MVVYQNECVDCGLSCLGASCPNRNVERYYCDECGESAEVNEICGMDLCDKCAEKYLDREAELYDAIGF